ncbi:hypothetical protein [Streptomyces sp. NPDC090057]|uniref:hypothetical protein n=1 Tax=Streptomyces sp. NPDC090057 TaxID=3365935 RepID=UPI0038072D63
MAATGRAAACVDPAARVAPQGHVLTAGDPMTTLTVEATVHHPDIVVRLPHAPGPSRAGPAAVRSTLDDRARGGTGRAALTDAERDALGTAAHRFPLLGWRHPAAPADACLRTAVTARGAAAPRRGLP